MNEEKMTELIMRNEEPYFRIKYGHLFEPDLRIEKILKWMRRNRYVKSRNARKWLRDKMATDYRKWTKKRNRLERTFPSKKHRELILTGLKHMNKEKEKYNIYFEDGNWFTIDKKEHESILEQLQANDRFIDIRKGMYRVDQITKMIAL